MEQGFTRDPFGFERVHQLEEDGGLSGTPGADQGDDLGGVEVAQQGAGQVSLMARIETRLASAVPAGQGADEIGLGWIRGRHGDQECQILAFIKDTIIKDTI